MEWFDGAVIGVQERRAELIALDDALKDLAEIDPRKGRPDVHRPGFQYETYLSTRNLDPATK